MWSSSHRKTRFLHANDPKFARLERRNDRRVEWQIAQQTFQYAEGYAVADYQRIVAAPQPLGERTQPSGRIFEALARGRSKTDRVSPPLREQLRRVKLEPFERHTFPRSEIDFA